MKIRISNNIDEIKELRKKKRFQLINIIIVLICGVCCIVFEEHIMFEIMGWFMIVVGTLTIFIGYILPILINLLFPLEKFIYKCRKGKRKLHLKCKAEMFKDYYSF